VNQIQGDINLVFFDTNRFRIRWVKISHPEKYKKNISILHVDLVGLLR
jgi:hypothetical protein